MVVSWIVFFACELRLPDISVAIMPKKSSQDLLTMMLLNQEQIDPKELSNTLAKGNTQ